MTKNLNQVVMSRPKFKTHFNAELFPHEPAVNSLPSCTLPDQSLTITQILRRFASGQPLGINTNVLPAADDDELEPDFAKMDYAEREEFADRAKQELDEIKARANERARKNRKPVVEDAEVVEEGVNDVEVVDEGDSTPDNPRKLGGVGGKAPDARGKRSTPAGKAGGTNKP